MAGRTLTVKQRRFVRHYVETGNGTQAALVAYDTADPNTARAIAAENLAKPSIQEAVDALLDASGLSDERLAAIHAYYLSLHRSDDPQEKALGLKALDMAYKLKGAYAPERHEHSHDIFHLFEQMTLEERQVWEMGEWPAQFNGEARRLLAARSGAVRVGPRDAATAPDSRTV